jgi:hypothetical protein
MAYKIEDLFGPAPQPTEEAPDVFFPGSAMPDLTVKRQPVDDPIAALHEQGIALNRDILAQKDEADRVNGIRAQWNKFLPEGSQWGTDFMPPPDAKPSEQWLASKRRSDAVGDVILGMTPVVGQALAAKSAVDMATEAKGEAAAGRYGPAAGFTIGALLSAAGAYPGAATARAFAKEAPGRVQTFVPVTGRDAESSLTAFREGIPNSEIWQQDKRIVGPDGVVRREILDNSRLINWPKVAEQKAFSDVFPQHGDLAQELPMINGLTVQGVSTRPTYRPDKNTLYVIGTSDRNNGGTLVGKKWARQKAAEGLQTVVQEANNLAGAPRHSGSLAELENTVNALRALGGFVPDKEREAYHAYLAYTEGLLNKTQHAMSTGDVTQIIPGSSVTSAPPNSPAALGIIESALESQSAGKKEKYTVGNRATTPGSSKIYPYSPGQFNSSMAVSDGIVLPTPANASNPDALSNFLRSWYAVQKP